MMCGLRCGAAVVRCGTCLGLRRPYEPLWNLRWLWKVLCVCLCNLWEPLQDLCWLYELPWELCRLLLLWEGSCVGCRGYCRSWVGYMSCCGSCAGCRCCCRNCVAVGTSVGG